MKDILKNPDKMQTRSMTKKVQFSVDIDFDGGYRCEKTTKKGEPCSLIACPFSDFCKRHQK